MDERLKKALDFSNYMVTLNNQKKIIQEKFYENIVFYTQGSKFTVTKELINFVNFLVDRDNTQFVLIDDNDLPVHIDNLEEFLENILDIYFKSTNNYYNDYLKLKNQRTVEKLVEYEN